jgi:hypothetical protein
VNIGMVPDSHSTAMVIDQHSVAEDTEDVGHHSTGVLRMWLVWAPVPLVRRSVGWDEDGCYSQMPIPRTSSFWHPSLYTHCLSQWHGSPVSDNQGKWWSSATAKDHHIDP